MRPRWKEGWRKDPKLQAEGRATRGRGRTMRRNRRSTQEGNFVDTTFPAGGVPSLLWREREKRSAKFEGLQTPGPTMVGMVGPVGSSCPQKLRHGEDGMDRYPDLRSANMRAGMSLLLHLIIED
ncbi:hypothetical protein KM043_016751 [Ampulex compressa]|nr:hypothetical protein KM043_016751 [Ampulex compressa]